MKLLNNKKLIFLLGLFAIPFGVFLFLKGGLLFLGALIIVPFIAIVAFFYPSFLLALLIIVTILEEVLFVSILEVVTLNQILGLILLSVILLKAIINKDINKLNHSITFLLLALFVILIFSYLLLSKGHDNPLWDIDQYLRSYVYFLICLLVIRNKNDLALVAFAFIFAGLIIMLSGFYWKAILLPIDYFSGHGRYGIRGIAGNYIGYAMHCMIPIPIVIYMLISKDLFKKKYYVFFLVIIVNLSIAMLLSGSRGAVLAYLFMVMIFAILSKLYIHRKILVASLLFLIPMLLPINEILDQIFLLFRGQLPTDYSTTMRAYFLSKLFTDLSLGSFLWGHGLENFRDYYSGVFNPPHSTWGQSFFELGIIGLFLQLYLVYKVVQIFMSLRKMKSEDLSSPLARNLILGFGISIFIFFFWGLYENVGFINGSKPLFILLGTFVAGSRVITIKNNE